MTAQQAVLADAIRLAAGMGSDLEVRIQRGLDYIDYTAGGPLLCGHQTEEERREFVMKVLANEDDDEPVMERVPPAAAPTNGKPVTATPATPKPPKAAQVRKPKTNDVEAMLHALSVFHDLDDVVELRIKYPNKRTESGYFVLRNEEALRTAFRSIRANAEGVYFVLNKIDRDLLSLAYNRIEPKPDKTTADVDIIARRFFFIDVDATRPAGVSARRDAHEAALACGLRIQQYLTERGFPEAVRGDSGNGSHLFFKLPADYPLTADGDTLIKRCLESLAAQFDSAGVKVDPVNSTRARLTKLYGSYARKGDDTPDQPHSLAAILEEPEVIEPVSIALLESLAAELPQPQQRQAGNGNGSKSSSGFDVEAFLAKHGIEVRKGPVPYGDGGRKWILKHCPFNSDHDKAGPAVLQLANGAIDYHCPHASCAEYDWPALRNHHEPGYRDRPQSKANGKVHGASETGAPHDPPTVFTADSLLALDIRKPKMQVDSLLQESGVCLVVGTPKSGKTLLAVQMAIAVASGHPLFNNYAILHPGPALVLEQDDPGGTASVRDILAKSPVPVAGIPFYLVPSVPFCFGELLLDWLDKQIAARGLRLVVLDSYTALRSSRSSGCDLVKVEQTDMLLLDQLANRTGCTVLVLHHGSKGAAGLSWTQQAAGSFAMTAAVQSQIHISRFADLDSNAPERLIRVEGRHLQGTEFVARFREATLDYEHVLENGAASVYPAIRHLQSEFGKQTFSAKDVSGKTGHSRATAYRLIGKLYHANLLTKQGGGGYAFSTDETW